MNILSVCYGVALGWPSASLLLLQSPDTPLPGGPLTTAECSWIGSLIALGGLCGNMLFGWLSGRIGRKPILLLAAVPMLSGWIMIYVAQNVNGLYAARLLHGISGGAACTAMPVYVAEIASVHIRGTLGSMFMLACNLGILLGFIMGHWLRYETLPLVLMVGSLLFLIGVYLLPETPQYLLRIGRKAVRNNVFFGSV